MTLWARSGRLLGVRRQTTANINAAERDLSIAQGLEVDFETQLPKIPTTAILKHNCRFLDSPDSRRIGVFQISERSF